MPNRVLKESLLTSKTAAMLSGDEERHFIRLLLLADDHGCLEITSDVIRGYCYSKMLDKVSEKKIESWTRKLVDVGLIKIWFESGRNFGCFVNFSNHSGSCFTGDGNKTRHRRKTPEPPKHLFPDGCEGGSQLEPGVANESQAEPVGANESQLEPLPDPNPNPDPNKEREKTPQAAHALTPEKLREIWNEAASKSNLQKCSKLDTSTVAGKKRIATAKARIREQPDEHTWRRVIASIRDCQWCNGGDGHGWRANFDYLIRPGTHLHAAEGKFRERRENDFVFRPPTETETDRKLKKWKEDFESDHAKKSGGAVVSNLDDCPTASTGGKPPANNLGGEKQ